METHRQTTETGPDRSIETEPEPTPETGPDRSPGIGPWNPLERRVAAAFQLAGVLLLASAVVPVGLEAVSDRAWVAGIVLASGAVVAVALGLLGTYPRAVDGAPRLARTGALAGVLAGLAALATIGVLVALLGGTVPIGPNLPVLEPAFAALALAMAGGTGIALVAVGIASRRADGALRDAAPLLVLGGGALLVPVLGFGSELAGGVGVPRPVPLLALAVVALTTLIAGRRLGGGTGREP